MSKDELNKKHEEEQEKKLNRVKTGLTIGSVAASAFGLAVATGTLAAKIVTGDLLGAAESVNAAVSVITKASGLNPVIDRAGKYLKEKFGDSKVLKFAGKAWEVATSKPVKMGLKIAGIGLAIASAPTPIGWGIIALSAGAMVASTVIGARSIGRNKRLAQEIQSIKEVTKGLDEPEKGKHPALDAFLAAKLSANKVHGVNAAQVGASVARGSIMESAALILEAVGTAGGIAAAAAGVAVFGGLEGEANEAIERQEKRNHLLAEREGARAKLVCAVLAKEPDIDKLTPQALEEKYNAVYKSNFQQSFGTKCKNWFKDVGSGMGEYIFGGLKKAFSKDKGHEATIEANAKQNAAEVAKGLQKERAVDAAAAPANKIPTHIEVEVEHNVPPPAPAPAATAKPVASAPDAAHNTEKPGHHHVLDPHFMETHTHVDKTEHSPHLGEGGGKMEPKVKSR